MDEALATNRVVVGVDLSNTGDNGLREAMRLTRQLPDSELHVVHVLEVSRPVHDARRLDELAGALRTRLDALKEHVATVCTPAASEGMFHQETVFHVRLGEAAAALHQVAVDVDADMIVVGSHGRRGLEKLVLGSVAEQLIRIARLPVVVAHPKDFDELPKSPHLEPAREGQGELDNGVSHRTRLSFRPRTSHISGLV